MNRETWLLAATRLLETEYFNKPSKALPKKLAVSCGIPKGSSRAIGQCWDPRIASDGTTHIFICPSLENPIEILGTLLHELIHACVGLQERHGGHFATMARKIGLQGKLTATYVEKETDLYKKLEEMLVILGDYPHKAMHKNKRVALKPQRPKRIKLVSPDSPEYTVTISSEVYEAMGSPKDPWGGVMIPLTKEKDES